MCTIAIKDSEQLLYNRLWKKIESRMENIRGYHPETFGEQVSGEMQPFKDDLQEMPKLQQVLGQKAELTEIVRL